MRKKLLLILLLIPMIGMSQIAPRIITLNGVPVNLSFDAAYTIPMSGGSIDSFIYSTRAWRQKGIDSVSALIPNLSGYATTAAVHDTAGNIRTYSQGNLVDTAGVLRAWANGKFVITETDPVATAKTETITNGWGLYGGGSGQSIGSNPAWTLGIDSINVASKARLYKVRDSILGIGYLTGVTLTAGSNMSVAGSVNAFTVTATPPGSSTQAAYNNGGAWASSTQVGYGSTDGNMLVSTGVYTTPVTAPASGTVKPYGNSINGQDELWVSNSSGVDIALETSLGQHQWGMFTTNGTAIQTTGYFASAITSSGTSSFNLRTYDATNLAPNLMYNKLTGTAAANNQVELYFGFTSRDAMIGNAAYGAGSKLVIDCVLPAYVSTQRFFAGYAATFGQIGTTADPSAQLNTIGVGKDVADATLFFMFNNGSGTATKVNTGITPTANDEYIITVTIPSNATSATVAIERRTKTTSTKNSATNSAKIPAAGTLMYWHAMSNSGATSTAPVIGIKYVWEELYN